MNSDRPRRLGRGLEALISGAVRSGPDPGAATPAAQQTAVPEQGPRRIGLALIRPNPFQPRKEFRPEELAELEASISASGLLQPVLLRPAPDGNGFELAAGERRLRAVTNLGWTEIPATVRNLSDTELLAVALVENLQRADLNPVEEAEGYARLIREFTLTQQQVADMVGKDRSTVANMLRILNLPSDVRAMLLDGAITMGHARALLTLGDEAQILVLARETASSGLSVREVERRTRVRKPTPPGVSDIRTQSPAAGSLTTPSGAATGSSRAHLRRIEDQLRKHLQTDARITLAGDDKGQINISFYSADDLDRLLDRMLGPDRDYR